LPSKTGAAIRREVRNSKTNYLLLDGRNVCAKDNILTSTLLTLYADKTKNRKSANGCGKNNKESFMNARMLWSRILIVIGSIAMLIGVIDPLEGSLIILLGSGLITLATFLGKSRHRLLLYWMWVFILITVGVGAMWWLTALGGIGGNTGRSMAWGLVVLPFPIGWIMGIIGIIVRLIEFIKASGLKVQS
jgi:hypothetical protein